MEGQLVNLDRSIHDEPSFSAKWGYLNRVSAPEHINVQSHDATGISLSFLTLSRKEAIFGYDVATKNTMWRVN